MQGLFHFTRASTPVVSTGMQASIPTELLDSMILPDMHTGGRIGPLLDATFDEVFTPAPDQMHLRLPCYDESQVCDLGDHTLSQDESLFAWTPDDTNPTRGRRLSLFNDDPPSPLFATDDIDLLDDIAPLDTGHACEAQRNNLDDQEAQRGNLDDQEAFNRDECCDLRSSSPMVYNDPPINMADDECRSYAPCGADMLDIPVPQSPVSLYTLDVFSNQSQRDTAYDGLLDEDSLSQADTTPDPYIHESRVDKPSFIDNDVSKYTVLNALYTTSFNEQKRCVLMDVSLTASMLFPMSEVKRRCFEKLVLVEIPTVLSKGRGKQCCVSCGRSDVYLLYGM